MIVSYIFFHFCLQAPPPLHHLSLKRGVLYQLSTIIISLSSLFPVLYQLSSLSTSLLSTFTFSASLPNNSPPEHLQTRVLSNPRHPPYQASLLFLRFILFSSRRLSSTLLFRTPPLLCLFSVARRTFLIRKAEFVSVHKGNEYFPFFVLPLCCFVLYIVYIVVVVMF